MGKSTKKYFIPKTAKNIVKEPVVLYAQPAKFTPIVADFPYKKFQKIADKIPFTQKEWAQILHLSERTLQRYAKDNSSFEGIYVDRILQIEQMVNMGLEAFNKADDFYNWLKTDKPVLGEVLNFNSLQSTNGIRTVTNEIGRILYGVYI